MAKLPSNFVKPTSFDNPLRPTSAVSSDESNPRRSLGVVGLVPADADPPANVDVPREEELARRFTLRLADLPWKLLHQECLERRMHGEQVRVADILREIVDAWVATRSTRSPVTVLTTPSEA